MGGRAEVDARWVLEAARNWGAWALFQGAAAEVALARSFGGDVREAVADLETGRAILLDEAMAPARLTSLGRPDLVERYRAAAERIAGLTSAPRPGQ